MDGYIGDNQLPVDEDAYLRDFLKAVLEKNLDYVKFIVPIIKEQEDLVLRSHDEVCHYFELATEDSTKYRFILAEALRLASHHGALDIVKYLLDQGAPVNGRDKQGYTPILKACERKQLEVIKTLLKSGANVNITNGVGSTPLQWVSRWSNLSPVVEILLDWPDTNRDDTSHKRGKSALHCAAELDEEGKNVELLLKHHATVNITTKDGWTPLHCAVERGLLHNARQLIYQGAHVNITENTLGCTALHIAAQLAYVDIVVELVDSGASVTVKDKVGLTPKERMLKYSKLSPGREDVFDGIVDILDTAENFYVKQKEIMLKVFAAVCEMIPAESWHPLSLDIFGDSSLIDKVNNRIVQSDPDTSLPLLIYKCLCEWLVFCPNTATFWVFMMALRDQQLHSIAYKMISKFATVSPRSGRCAQQSDGTQDNVFATKTIELENTWKATSEIKSELSALDNDYSLE